MLGSSNWFLFLFPAFIWGTTWLTIKFQLGVVAPELSVVYRFGLASALLFAFCRIRGISLSFDRRAHAKIFVLGLLQYAVNYVLIYESERHFTSGLIAVIYVLVMVWNLLGGRLFFGRAVPPLLLLGAGLGIVGIMLVFWPEVARFRAAPGEWAALAQTVTATLAGSVATLFAEKFYREAGVGIVPTTAWAMFYASVAVFAFCLVRGVPLTFDLHLPYVSSLLYLSLFGSIFAFVGYLTLLRRIGSGRAGYTAVAVPVLAMAMSTLFEGYVWTLPALLGMGLVIAGNLLVLSRKLDKS